MKKFGGTEPSGCSFWRLAADGGVFYTVAENHFNCAVGAYTHNIALSPERQKETEQTLKMMFDLGYVKPEEVPQIPRLPKAPATIVYAPLGEAPVAPDVVLFACRPSAAMLLKEAANRVGVDSPCRPSGARRAWPYQLLCNTARFSASAVSVTAFTETWGEDELYFVLRGRDVAAVANSLAIITSANAALNDYAKGRRSQLATI